MTAPRWRAGLREAGSQAALLAAAALAVAAALALASAAGPGTPAPLPSCPTIPDGSRGCY